MDTTKSKFLIKQLDNYSFDPFAPTIDSKMRTESTTAVICIKNHNIAHKQSTSVGPADEVHISISYLRYALFPCMKSMALDFSPHSGVSNEFPGSELKWLLWNRIPTKKTQ